MVIRDFKRGDEEFCAAIYAYYVSASTVSFEEKVLSSEEFLLRAEKIAERYPYLVAENDGKVLGYAYLYEFGERSAYRFCADLSVYVESGSRGKGIGETLVREIERRAKDMGITEIVSVITGENAVSMRFHEKMGYKFKGKLDKVGCKFGRWLDVCFYQKEIK